MTTTPAAVNNADSPKKRYEPPRLELYGDIRKITQTVGSMSSIGDGAGHVANNKTA